MFLAALDNMGFVANLVSLVLYFSFKMHFDLSSAANTLTNLMGSAFLLSFVGGLISDTYINRFKTCLIFGCLEVLALSMMTIQAHDDNLLPKPCGKSSCIRGGIAVYFYTSLCFLALGIGGVKGSLPALGADQFDAKNPKEAKGLASYFNWLLLSSVVGSSIGVTVIVWFATNKNNENWWKDFLLVPLVHQSDLSFLRWENRSIAYKSHEKALLWLDKAAIPPRNVVPSPWKVCTLTQVEEVKILTRMLPIIASTILLNTCMAQLQTFSVQQGYRMDPHLGSFQVPAASIPIIPLLFMIILIPIYDRLFVPFIRNFTKHPSGITQLQRIGVGLVLSALSMAVAGVIEVKRRNHSLKNPLKPISLFWLAFQYGIFGIADMFTLVGSLEFFYKEAPAGMRSLSTSFTYISQSFGYFLSSVFVSTINSVTKRISPSKQGWLYGQDLDRNNLNLFFWFLAILSGLNFLCFLYFATWYEYKNDDNVVVDKNAVPTSQSINPLFKAASQEDLSKAVNGGSAVELTNGKV
ncbi:hypothetical protein F511_44202 [Dorcoceras hygrometricum]|uniref:Protein NRT1/ PTR FAMILY 4.5-like n=1 Tax=Dorcoceras hygrometricum TaxID=472368 RepID=A0A2Z6ZYF0_9LAMI|nr:hypothetical protein F511_44202 [Dorcoceras hygrometricum]